MDGAHGYSTVCMYLMPLSYTLKKWQTAYYVSFTTMKKKNQTSEVKIREGETSFERERYLP